MAVMSVRGLPSTGQLAVQELGAAAELAQRQQRVVADHAARPGPQCGQLGDFSWPTHQAMPDPIPAWWRPEDLLAWA